MIAQIFRHLMPVLFASLGGLLTDIAGVLNIALEGFILIGAFSVTVATILTGNLAAGIILGNLATILIAFLYSTAAIKLKTNIFMSGLAMNLFAAGMVGFVSQWSLGTKGVISMSEKLIPQALRHGGILSIAAVLCITATAGVIYMLYNTRFGLRVRAAGSVPELLRARGGNPERTRIAVLTLSGAFCGLAGTVLSVGLGAFVPNMSAGRGWIALVAVYIGNKHPAGILIATILFAAAEELSYSAQGFMDIPDTILLASPYLVVLIGMIISSIIRYRKSTTAYSNSKCDI